MIVNCCLRRCLRWANKSDVSANCQLCDLPFFPRFSFFKRCQQTPLFFVSSPSSWPNSLASFFLSRDDADDGILCLMRLHCYFFIVYRVCSFLIVSCMIMIMVQVGSNFTQEKKIPVLLSTLFGPFDSFDRDLSLGPSFSSSLYYCSSSRQGLLFLPFFG